MDVVVYTAAPRITFKSRQFAGYAETGTGDPDGSLPSAWFSGTNRTQLRYFLNQNLDILVVALPLTLVFAQQSYLVLRLNQDRSETTRMLSDEEFAVMAARKPFLVNIARGAIIDQPAMIKALETGQLCGAAIDVAEPEPLPPTHPLWLAPNIIITPHVGGMSSKYNQRAFDLLVTNLERMEAGMTLLNVVDRDRGY
jgi:phosphoglycerate dehydrogenase-like enzyme